MEGASPKPLGFLRSAQPSPGHPIHQSKRDRALVCSEDVLRRCGSDHRVDAADLRLNHRGLLHPRGKHC